jgi:16S rRNA (cytosine967-C5)-methyltransferase
MYKMYRLAGILDRAAAKALGEDVSSIAQKPALLRQALRLAAYLAQFDEVGDPRLPRLLLRYGLPYLASRYGWREARKVAKVLERLSKDPWRPSSEIEKLELKYMVPAILIERVRKLLPASEVEELLKALNLEPDPGLRVNTLKASIEEVVARLSRSGFSVRVSERVPNHVKYRGPFLGEVAKLVDEGKAVPQDESSALASLILDPKPGELVVDLCAAPGGKTTHIAELMNVNGSVVAFDIYHDRVQRLVELARRTGTYTIIHPLEADARLAPNILGVEVADRALVDPPCTSTGALAKHPDARWRISEENIRALARQQKELLQAAVQVVRKGGYILYTVCSILPEEGEEVVKWALENLPVELVPLKGPYDPSPLLPGTMRAWPHRHRVTGFFYALLRKR